jgi:hypothetical protein
MIEPDWVSLVLASGARGALGLVNIVFWVGFGLVVVLSVWTSVRRSRLRGRGKRALASARIDAWAEAGRRARAPREDGTSDASDGDDGGGGDGGD